MRLVVSHQLKLWTGFVCILLFFFPFFLQKTNLLASDLGRHITNGRIILQEHAVFSNNRYSYTMPERAAPNHHWLFGVIAYLIEQRADFAGLTLLSATLYTAAVGVGVLTAWQYARFRSVAVAAGILAPLVTMRFEVRPEAFSLLFFATEVWLLSMWQQKKLSASLVLGSLFGIAVLWVNIHIFFSLQAVLIAAFFMSAVLSKDWQQLRVLLGAAACITLGSLLNPLGLEGALYPARIFGEYGYRVAENQPVWFLLGYSSNPHYIYVCLALVLLLVLCVWFSLQLLRTQKARLQSTLTPHILLTLLFTLFTARMIRFEQILFLSALPLAGYSVSVLFRIYTNWQKNFKQKELATSVLSFAGVCIAIAMLGSSLWSPFKQFGLGLMPANRASGDFFKKTGLQGPLFNNFDIGSYLIYELYDDEHVFVDNRAEAYSDELFVQYRNAQQDQAAWNALAEEYNIQVIFFNRNESTEWAQEFLVARVKDRENWVPVFVDPYSIIFVKNTPENAAIIEQYALPKSMFGIKKNSE